MPRPRNPALREHVTRVGFDLSLSKTQIAALVVIVECYSKDLDHNGYGSPWSHFISGVDALKRRGLVWHDFPVKSPEDWKNHPPSHFYGLTAAGQYVVGLLSESGLWDDYLALFKRHQREGYMRVRAWQPPPIKTRG